MSQSNTAGFALVPVVLMLALVGSIAFILGEETRMTGRSVNQKFEVRQAAYTAEAGFHHARWQIQKNTTCAGYTAVAGGLSSTTYATSVTPDSGGPVALTSTSLAGNDSTRQITGSITTYSETNTLVLQPGAAGIDALIWDGAHSDENFGASEILRLDNTGKEQAILIQFDLSALQNGAILRRADLELYAYSGTNGQNGEVAAYNITRSWVEGVEDDKAPNPGEGVTYDQYDGDQDWTNAGGDYQPSPSALTTIPDGTPGWFSWDLTDSVQAWMSGALNNHGVLLRVSSGAINRREFASSDAADATLHPKLTIEYACACGTPCSDALIIADSVVLSSERDGILGGEPFENVDLVEYNPGDESAAIRLEGVPAGLNGPIDALHILSDGSLVLSTQNDETLGGLSFSKDDLIRYDPANDLARSYFKSHLHFDSAGASIDAVFVRPSGELLLSTENASTLAGISIQDNDIVEFDPRTQAARLFFDGDSEGLNVPPSGLHVLADGRIVFAAQQDTSFAGLSLFPNDLVEYDPASGGTSLYMSGSTAYGADENEIEALYVLDGQNAANPTDPRLVAHWKLDETTGLIAEDSAGDHDGTLDTPTWAVGRLDGAADFDGAGDVISVPHAEPLSVGGEFTFSAWFRAERLSLLGGYRILSKETPGRNDNYFLSLMGSSLYLGIDGQFFSPPALFATETWYHVAATFDDRANTVRIYVNGALALSTFTFASLTPNTDPLLLGSNWQGSKHFDGLLDEIRIYNYALADHEIADLAAGLAPGGGAEDTPSPGGGGDSPGTTGTTGTYRDEFRSDDTYAGSDGSLDWSTPWVEINESDGPGQGDERISADFDRYELRIADNDGEGEGVARAVDLSQCAAAVLSFDYRRRSFDRSSDAVTVSASDDGGDTWKELQVIEGPGNDESLLSAKHDLTGFMSAETQIRFLTSATLGRSDFLYVDNVEISCE